VLELGLDEIPALAQMAGRRYREGQAARRDAIALLQQLNVGVLRGDARRGVGARRQRDVTVFVERRGSSRTRSRYQHHEEPRPDPTDPSSCHRAPSPARDNLIH
jgi:hypothetical protein